MSLSFLSFFSLNHSLFRLARKEKKSIPLSFHKSYPEGNLGEPKPKQSMVWPSAQMITGRLPFYQISSFELIATKAGISS